MKKVLVTGATGFIGTYVVQQLLEAGHHVVATSSIQAKAALQSWYTAVTYLPLSLEELDPVVDYQAYFQHPDALIHLAWEGLPNYKSDFHLTQNLPRHQALLNNLVTHGLRDVTVIGTCFEYGMQEGCLREDMPAQPANPYAQAKDELRRYATDLLADHGGIFKWVRLFYMYGEGQNPKSLLSQLEKALQNGDTEFNMSGGAQVRDYLPVTRVAANIVRISLQQQVTGIINCCSGIPITVKELVAQYLANANKAIRLNLGYYPYPDYEPMYFWGDIQKLKSIPDNE